MLWAWIGGAGAIVLGLYVTWASTWTPRPAPAIPIEIVEPDLGGYEDGAPDESLMVEAPAPESSDPSAAEEASESTEVKESFDNLVDAAAEVEVDRAIRRDGPSDLNAGRPGSAAGTGRRPLGLGGGTRGGVTREQRWLVRYGDSQTLDEYARQLDFFGIELGTISQGKLVYVSNFSKPQPTVRRSSSGADETRLYFTWQGGTRRAADLQFFTRAGVDVGTNPIFQFYAKPVENQLAQLELAFKGRKVERIRRTIFDVRSKGVGQYEYYVSKQLEL